MTLVAPDLESVNTLGVVIMVLGKERGVRLISSTPGLDGFIVDRDGTLWMSQEFRARLRTPP